MKRAALLGLAAAASLYAQAPTINITPTSLSFGNVLVGTRAERTFTVSTRFVIGTSEEGGTVEQTAVYTIELTRIGPDAINFATSPAFSFTLASGGSQEVTVFFGPNRVGSFSASVQVSARIGTGTPFYTAFVTLSATGTATFTAAPSSINFGNVRVGTIRQASLTVSVPTSIGVVYDFTAQVVSGGASFSVSPTNFELGGGDFPLFARTLTVTFSPGTIGTLSGAIRIQAFYSGNLLTSQTISLTGTGVAGFTVNPTSLSLGEVLLGCTNVATFQVTVNTASTPAATVAQGVLLSFTVVSSNPAFTVSPPSFNTGSSQTVTVTFRPTTPGTTSSAIITITASIEGTAVQTTNLEVQGTGVDIIVTPSSLNFGSVPVGTTSAPRTVSLNFSPPSGTIVVGVNITSNNQAFRATGITTTGQTNVTFMPPSDGNFSGVITFTLTREDGGFPACTITRTLSVQGVGIRIDITVTPTSIDFGRVAINTTSAARTATVNNNSDVSFTGTVTGTEAAFSFTPATFTVAARGTQTLTFTFRPPRQGGLSSTISLALRSTGVEPPVNITLTISLLGEGQAPAALTVAPDRIDFGDVPVGSSLIRPVTVNNTGGTAASVSAATTNPAFSAAPTSFNLNAGAAQSVSITFTPPSEGPFEATATFSITGTSRIVTLAGRGIAPQINFTFTSGAQTTPVAPGGNVPLGNTNVGTPSSLQFRVANAGTGSATVSSVTFTNPAFSAADLPALPATLAPGGSLAFRVVFNPQAPGRLSGTLTIDGRTFNLSGTGLIPSASIIDLPGTLPPADQVNIGVQLPARYPVEVRGTLTFEAAPNVGIGGADPAMRFASGPAASAEFVVPAGEDVARFGTANRIGFQTGTVAAAVTFRVNLSAGGVDVTPVTTPAMAASLPRRAPVLRSFTIQNRTATGFQGVAVIYATSREVNTLQFRLNASGSGNLQTSQITVDVAGPVANWYRGGESAQHGSLFTVTVPFTVSGDISAIRSVSVTASNGDGSSQAIEGNL